MLYTCRYQAPFSGITLASDGVSLTGLWLDGQKRRPDALLASASGGEDIAVLRSAAAWLDRYFAGLKPDIGELALAPAGTAFQRAVWKLLCNIPYGEVMTYGEIAARLPGRTSPRAVGGAVGRNPISIIIPCHRVVGADGSLTGYAGGLEAKKKLLALEAR